MGLRRPDRKLPDNVKPLALGCQAQAGIQAYELPALRPVFTGKQRRRQLQRISSTQWVEPQQALRNLAHAI